MLQDRLARGLRVRGRQQRALALALLLSILVHGLVLWTLRHPSLATVHVQHPAVLRVTMRELPSIPQEGMPTPAILKHSALVQPDADSRSQTTATPAGPASAAPLQSATATATGNANLQPDAFEREPDSNRHGGTDVATAPLPVNTPEIPGMAASTYLPAEQLTVRPRFLRYTHADITAATPDIRPAPVIAHLLINAGGQVDRVVLEENWLSDAARKLIIDSFSAMEFSPGMLGNMAVNSELRIEVALQTIVSTTVLTH